MTFKSQKTYNLSVQRHKQINSYHYRNDDFTLINLIKFLKHFYFHSHSVSNKYRKTLSSILLEYYIQIRPTELSWDDILLLLSSVYYCLKVEIKNTSGYDMLMMMMIIVYFLSTNKNRPHFILFLSLNDCLLDYTFPVMYTDNVMDACLSEFNKFDNNILSLYCSIYFCAL